MESSFQPTLVLVSGSGRSGTSSLAGSLKRLGLHVPQPEVQPSPNNPRGYYEPEWVIAFHKDYLSQLAMHNIDSRPGAIDLVAELTSSGEPRIRLVDWLRTQLPEPQLVVKDPHAFWFADLWAEACADVGADLRWLTALRHPAEVVGSRDLAYLRHQPDDLRLAKETSNVAGWVHAALLTERAGRGGRHAFVRYVDLIADWRRALAPVQRQLALDFNTDLASTEHHDVDDFLEPSMRRSQLGWEDIRVPSALQELAEEVWQILSQLVMGTEDRDAQTRLDELYDTYRTMYTEAIALTLDHSRGEARLAAREARRKQQQTVRRLRKKLRQQRAGSEDASSDSSEAGRLLARIGRRLRQ